MPEITLTGDVAIVTGGGKGIGRAHCLELGRRGASVLVNDMDRDSADEVVEEIISAGGVAAVSYESVASPEGANAIVSAAVQQFGSVDAVVNNAGTMRNGYFEDQTPEMLDAMLDVHVRGTFFVTQAAWPIMQAKAYGRVVITSSGGGLFAMQGDANYAAAKAGLFGLCKSLAFEGERWGIRVNSILPTAATTITAKDPIPDMDVQLKPGLREALGKRRSPEAIAPLVSLLASRECPVSGEAYLLGCGVYSRVFVGVGPGWVAPQGRDATAEEILEHWNEVQSTDPYAIFRDNFDKNEFLARANGWEPSDHEGL